MAANRYDPQRDITPRFLDTVVGWLAASSELFVVMRYLGAAGGKDYAFIHNEAEFRQLVDACPNGTDIIVFRDWQLPIRGTVTGELISETLKQIPDGAEYLVVCMVSEKQGDMRLSGDMGDTHLALVDHLSDIEGQPAAVGLCPPFIEPDNDAMISASKGGVDGPR